MGAPLKIFSCLKAEKFESRGYRRRRTHDAAKAAADIILEAAIFLTVLVLALANFSSRILLGEAQRLFAYARYFREIAHAKIAQAKRKTWFAFGACAVATTLFFACAKL
ncbi:hypothetical protein ISCGN_028704 [Ixodes scapularis]